MWLKQGKMECVYLLHEPQLWYSCLNGSAVVVTWYQCLKQYDREPAVSHTSLHVIFR